MLHKVLPKAIGGVVGGQTALRLQLGGLVFARADITQIADRADWTDNPTASYKSGDIVLATVLPALQCASESTSPGAEAGTDVAVSLRPSIAIIVNENSTALAPVAGKRRNADDAISNTALARTCASIAAVELEELNGACTVGAVVSGFVVSSGKKGVFVRIARGATARVGLSQLSEQYLRNPSRVFPCGKLVTGVIVASEGAAIGRCNMSLLRAEVKAAMIAVNKSATSTSGKRQAAPQLQQNLLGWDDLRVGLVLAGAVSKVAEYGVFVSLDNSNRNVSIDNSAESSAVGSKRRRSSSSTAVVVPISGLCHVSEIDPSGGSENVVAPKGRSKAASAKLRVSLESRFHMGDRVRVAIMSVDPLKKVISFSMKAATVSVDAVRSDGTENVAASSATRDSGDEDDEDASAEEEEESDDEDSSSNSEPVETSASSVSAVALAKNLAPLATGNYRAPAVSGIFSALLRSDGVEEDCHVPIASQASGSWARSGVEDRASKTGGDDGSSGASDSSESDADVGAPSASALRRQNKNSKAASEAETTRREDRLASGEADANPETSEDFERLVAGHPNSSLVWIKYIAWLMQVRLC